MANALNLTALLDDAAAVHAADRGQLRSTLIEMADELAWLETVADSTAGLPWPADAPKRIERLRAEAGAWDAVAPPSLGLVDSVRACLEMLPSSAARTALGPG